MTALRVEQVYVTPEEYLAAEELSETKHEFLDGVVYAMAGASRQHVRITGNIYHALRRLLAGKPCEPFGPDARLKIRRDGATYFYYSDAVVDCTGSEEGDIEEPTVIFEVLSPSTERNDRGDKLTNYQSIASMRVYVLVDQSKPAVTIYRRSAGEAWNKEFVGDLAATVELPEIACALPMAAIYERVL
jgi:Uma2 family endonuclease